MNILFTGDFYISDSYQNKTLIDHSIVKLFNNVDYRIVNNEAPITVNNAKNKILKTGPHLHTEARTTLPYLNQLKVDLVTLANNHIMDFGIEGLEDTLNSLRSNSINYVGVGNNLDESAEPFTIKTSTSKIAVLNFTENEWSVSTDSKPGANPLDIIENVQQIMIAKQSHEKVIVVIHGGHEYYNLPSPRMVKQYHFYADNGADIIIGHHPHCISGYEDYNGTPIFYSLGNFVFTLKAKFGVWNTGLILKLEIDVGKKINCKLFHIKQDINTHKITFLKGSELTKAEKEFDELSAIIKDKNLLRHHWNNYIDEHQEAYLYGFSPINILTNQFILSVFRRLKAGKFLIKPQNLKLILNLMRCESHSDATKEVIWNYINKK